MQFELQEECITKFVTACRLSATMHLCWDKAYSYIAAVNNIIIVLSTNDVKDPMYEPKASS